jgi:anti-sigma regulatory factor (Ser/Thr protein kinase)
VAQPARDLFLELRSTREEVGRAVEALLSFCAEAGADEEVSHDLALATDEVLANIVLHGYRSDPAGRILFRARHDGATFTLEFSDGAPAHDPLAAAPPDLDLPAAERPIGGLGIHLVRTLMDAVEYRREEGENRLTLRRRVGTPSA